MKTENVLVCDGRVDKQMFNTTKQFLKELTPFSAGFIIIASRGGELNFGQKMTELIIERESNNCNSIYTVAGERVSSSALIPYIAGLKRLAMKETKFLFHRVQSDPESSTKYTRAKDRLAEKSCVSFLAKKLKIEESYIWDLMDNNTELNFDEAVKIGLVTGSISKKYYDKLAKQRHLT